MCACILRRILEVIDREKERSDEEDVADVVAQTLITQTKYRASLNDCMINKLQLLDDVARPCYRLRSGPHCIQVIRQDTLPCLATEMIAKTLYVPIDGYRPRTLQVACVRAPHQARVAQCFSPSAL